MVNKTVNGRIVHKHDSQTNWEKAINFVPMAGELIVYDIDNIYSYERIKIGDGATNVNALPFVDDSLRTELTAQINELNDSVDTMSTLVGDTSISEQISTAVDGKMNAENPVGTGSFSMGRKSGSTTGNGSYAVGYNVTASGAYSHAEGFKTIASGNYSHAEGNVTTASGFNSHVEGYYTMASGEYSHAEGVNTKASAYGSHAEGTNTTASNSSSHAEGANTTASGNYSHAEGYYANAKGDHSHAEGLYTLASGQSTHVQGEYNIDGNNGASHDDRGTYVHIIGNGTDENNRSNAHTLDWDGNAWFAGGLKIGGTGQDDTAAKNIATEEYVDSTITAITTDEIDEICGASIVAAREIEF